ncbi:putative Heat shock protein 70 family [Helianthus annuus]|uniref:Heat shock protein 70 family n=1 Tax=Helianthus annuus TaxID=4232 RepID=A0A9K3GZX5_HELAN|nr:heat shock 70 kDa protein 8 [Helianthus annuus]KAF5761353.1 putative Heat shock protein 70 family [Helianthus annuus]KAJ0645869.1 putative Heat shock protein 70 family [Helianthus annuus]KAJ0822461.1 putative Heat shock protein 70 family [Helianthus annuus]
MKVKLKLKGIPLESGVELERKAEQLPWSSEIFLMSEEVGYTVASDSETTATKEETEIEIAIGIDIGTCQCSLAVWNGSEVELIRNTRNQKLMKSYVTFRDQSPSPVGGVTNQLSHEYEMLSGSSIFNMKRLIGRLDTDPIVHQASNTLPFLIQTLGIGAKPFLAALVNNMWRSTTPEEVVAIYLVELKALAEARLKRPVRDVVLTVPAAFSRFQLTRIARSCAMAGLHVLRFMPEPAAVALLYAQQQLHKDSIADSGSEKIGLIFNMGAGYCDVAIIATAGGVSQMKALAGSCIGGEDLLQNMMHHLVPDMDTRFASRGLEEIKAMGILRVATQEAIHKLSFQPSVQIDIDLGNGTRVCRVIDVQEFEEINKGVFEKCASLVTQCLHESKVAKPEYIDDVILVGGCTNIPKLKSIVMGICKRNESYSGINPLEAAVRGAALEGALASGVNDPFGSLDLLTIQINAHSIGIRADGNSFVPIIDRNTTLPARREMLFTTAHDNQTEALIVVYEQGDEQQLLLGYFKVVGIPPAAKGVPEINVCMDIDASNMLRVMAGVVMPGSGTKNPVVPLMEVRMPTADDGHGLCADALYRSLGSTLDLVTLHNKLNA